MYFSIERRRYKVAKRGLLFSKPKPGCCILSFIDGQG